MRGFLFILLPILVAALGLRSPERPTETNPSPKPPAPRIAYDRQADSLILDSLRATFGQNKTLPAGYELPALRALSHYPELRDYRVSFVYRKNPVAHTSRPKNGSLFLRRSRRHYLVIISTELSPLLEQGMLRHLSYNAQIGVLGHELAHTVDYLDRGLGNLLALGIRYSSSKRVARRWERFTDSTAIRHNLGYQLRAWSQETHHILEEAGRGQNYLTPEEIDAFMQTLSAYQ